MLAEQGAQAAQSDGIATLLSAREKQRLDIGAMHEMMLAKFNELPKGGIPGTISAAASGGYLVAPPPPPASQNIHWRINTQYNTILYCT